jgi:hypothetical protein
MSTKITLKAYREYLKKMLSTNRVWAAHALIQIYRRQTADEKAAQATTESNSVGFAAFDAEILTSFAEQWQRRQWLSDKQWEILLKRIHCYWRQILEVSDRAKLDARLRSEQTTLNLNNREAA